jgi:hypothetical protein
MIRTDRTGKIRSDDFGDAFQMIEGNELGREFVADLEPDVTEKFLEILSRSKATDETPTN